ncbi:MAG: hypothetical protein PHW10_05595 [Candidatus Peribacteraceae bacterium]|nr:hypothetical protein [Candidatus Peribacteraceae bacterium]
MHTQRKAAARDVPRNAPDAATTAFSSPSRDRSVHTLSTSSRQRTMALTSRSSKDSANKNPEKLAPFIPTPERVSQFLENMKPSEVEAQLKSNEGRQQLFKTLMQHEDHLRKIHNFNPEDLRKQLDLVGETLQKKKAFMEDVKSPEKKGLFRRAWDKIKGFPRKHPVITAILVLAAIAGVGAGIAYYAGSLELLWHKAGEKLSLLFGDALKTMPIEPGSIDPGSAVTYGFE